jgi:succinate dehydrogenase/fumarate reductase flavoprotein subunit
MKPASWDAQADVVVMGTGAAGLVATLAAREKGASVALLEKTTLVGGTTAISGGVVWVPNNHHMAQAGLVDSREDAIRYIERMAEGRGDRELIERYVDECVHVVRFLEDQAAMRFHALTDYPDYQPELPGGRAGGRPLDQDLFDTNELGAFKDALRRNPVNGGAPMTIREAMAWNVFANPSGFPFREVRERYRQGIVHGGTALVGRLLKACLDRGVEPRLSSRARELVKNGDGGVIGVRVEEEGRALHIRADRGVILASGGFEWNAELCRRFLAGIPTHPSTPPANEGDGLVMAMAMGAELESMSQAWWCPSVVVPGEHYDGAPMNRPEFSIRCLPHSLIVNRRGARFTNEAHNYNDMSKPFFHHDPWHYEQLNVPAWLIVDQSYLDKYAFLTTVPGRPMPAWIACADTPEDLAVKLGIDPAGLRGTLDRFNRYAETGVDADFGRGESAFSRFYGDRAHAPNPNLGKVDRAPFYGVPIYPGTLGTKGGPRVDADARVRRVGGGVVDGLYAAGNAMGSFTGPGYPGPGVTIAAAMTFGYLAARHAANRSLDPSTGSAAP